MRTTRLLACASAFAMLAFAPAAQAGHGYHGKKAPKTTVRGIVQHQTALQNIADMAGGTRHTETPGYTASVAYVRLLLITPPLETARGSRANYDAA